MNYCTYPEYQAAGGTVSELAFGVLCSRASRLIDSATFGKAEPHAAVCEDCRQMRAALPAAEKAKHWTLKRGWKVVQGAVQSLTAEEYARLEKTHPCCTVAAVSDNREPLLPHWHVEGR